jgi:prepilin-type processing-associated H-X9-DG protein
MHQSSYGAYVYTVGWLQSLSPLYEFTKIWARINRVGAKDLLLAELKDGKGGRAANGRDFDPVWGRANNYSADIYLAFWHNGRTNMLYCDGHVESVAKW